MEQEQQLECFGRPRDPADCAGFIAGATVRVVTSTGKAVKQALVTITQFSDTQLTGFFDLRNAVKPG